MPDSSFPKRIEKNLEKSAFVTDRPAQASGIIRRLCQLASFAAFKMAETLHRRAGFPSPTVTKSCSAQEQKNVIQVIRQGIFSGFSRHKTIAGKKAENYFERSVVRFILCMGKENRL